MSRPKGFVVSFVVFHERGFFVPADRFICGVLFEYGLQPQHLNPNDVQQMVAFEVMCEGTLGLVPIGTSSSTSSGSPVILDRCHLSLFCSG
jgi:hypothetical protein